MKPFSSMNKIQTTRSASTRKSSARYLALAGLVGGLALGIAGCTIRGGGWLTSLLTGEKATFAFNGTAVETEEGLVRTEMLMGDTATHVSAWTIAVSATSYFCRR